MWDCEHCGCQAIAGSVAWCPMCGKERDMPKITRQGGPSNAAADAEQEEQDRQDAAADRRSRRSQAAQEARSETKTDKK